MSARSQAITDPDTRTSRRYLLVRTDKQAACYELALER